VENLLDAGASVEVVSPKTVEGIDLREREGRIRVKRRVFRRGDLKGIALVIVATDDARVNASISRQAEKQRVLCNVVDQPELCTVIFPSLLRRGRLQIAVSTGGASPALAAKVREEMEAVLGEEYDTALEILWRIRKLSRGLEIDAEKRSDMLRRLAQGDLVRACKEGDAVWIDGILKEVVGSDVSLQTLGMSVSPHETIGPGRRTE
jgi:precorrin-2 dehydrogenase/sirohydrochlorin ferrochelatase